MDLDQLRYFLRVAQRQSFTRAAEDLNISQPALSRSIQRLEEEVGQPVFERKTRSVSLTDAGVLLQARAEQVLAILEDTKAEITDDGQSGRVRVGAIPTIAPYFLPQVLRQFSEEFPKATLIVQENTTDALLKSCTQGEIDLAILALPVAARYLDMEEMFEEELLLVLPPQHVLVDKEKIRLTDVEPYPFVLLDEAHCLSDNIVSFCRQRSFQPVAVERTSQLAMVQELVSLAHGISMIPAMARALDQSDRRVYRSFTGRKPTRTVAVVWNPYRFHSRLIKAFRERLRQK
ncbi:LysR family transcriptional regulator [Planctomicrobium piriforme]|uniref:LysR family transcriptional regulator, hydrogen peroxide-inducible genes activator n=1 Tax=Planctomicrobium piriforme TaxID=1576369 RepID=A0A1I3PIA4_9PLAN|nr:LysR family transcriptional regulator [Planctomicrobium piriforme]SFJ21077.1 LysR family transcriptional regulator, hydrogen peroxide-inducible genes activator [Planctomicrobium piriforme]